MAFSVNSILTDAKVSLEKTAADQFGAVVEDFSKQASKVIGGVFSPGSTSNRFDLTEEKPKRTTTWNATSYAAHLAGGNDFRPKLKFLFKVEFIFNADALKIIHQLSPNFIQKTKDFTFMIKYVDRPKIDFEYEEEVNMYNFRTKVLKKVRHRDLTIIFMDDVGNRVFDFFRMLMMLHSPITRRQTGRDLTMTPPTGGSVSNGSGMAFSGDNVDNAHRGVVNSTFGNSIEAIRVKQMFIDPSPSEGVETMLKMVSFDFLNPRIVSFDLDELSHEANDVNLLTMVFDYDWMEMVNIGSLGKDVSWGDDQKTTVVTQGITDVPSDISSNKTSGGRSVGSGNIRPTYNGGQAANDINTGLGKKDSKSNPFVDAISGVLGRQVTNLTNEAINKLIPPNGAGLAGKFGNIVNSQLGKVAAPLIGIVQGTAKDKLNVVADATVNYAKETYTSIKNKSVVSDSTTAGADAPTAVVSSTSKYQVY